MKAILSRLFNHEELNRKEAKNLLLNITRGMYNDAQIAALLTVFQMRGIKVEELIGFREALLTTRIPIDDLPQMRLYTNVFQKLGIGFAVVNNLDGYDEISLTDEFKVMTNHYETIYKPSELGFSLARQEELYGGNTPEEASKIFHNVLENKATKAQTDCVLINASFAIQAMEPAKPIEECVAIARESLESGKALNTLKKFVELNS